MSKLRPELVDSNARAIPDDTALFLIRDSVETRKELLFGAIEDGKGHYCAIGCFFKDNPRAVLNSSLIDEVASVNDSVPISASPQKRWKKVSSWLRFKIKVMMARK